MNILKRCPRCLVEKQLSEFNSQGKCCLECHRLRSKEWRQRNPEKQKQAQKKYKQSVIADGAYKEKQRAFQRKSYQKNPLRFRARADQWKLKSKVFIFRVKRRFGCMDCAERFPPCLQFHHLGEKKHSIANMPRMGFGVKAIKNEMRKCHLLCGNCHVKRHHRAHSSMVRAKDS